MTSRLFTAIASLSPFAIGVLASVASAQPSSSARSPSQAFSICGSGQRITCVVDGDTFWFRGEKIRIADIDTPELSPPRCERERERGLAAKQRLLDILNSGPISLQTTARDEDRFGRKLRIVYRDRRSVGDILVAEGLARKWQGSRRSWCE
ncbi:thermonuclease family protein [Agrobacterium vitis]|uniref:Nuclease n=2 Tax=Agrobacterium TaxID=357 RepID=A0A2Z2PWN5_AGRTU|nr:MULTISPECIES: thermonuclease family protein [Rhizobium/Agrobacterium group]ASK47018.1 nuclease [Agrobacterium radiobacter]MCE6078403.1 thermonuclease family protein [Agrobacterium vitis]MCF1455854.1 thermonuclease family protein [Agrobacterium vitis]MCF1465189.1 thermonuclease family protein [Allorhizobium ampelinum]MCF1470012.1 thermonuclease family protein [Agrobacterium vitis]